MRCMLRAQCSSLLTYILAYVQTCVYIFLHLYALPHLQTLQRDTSVMTDYVVQNTPSMENQPNVTIRATIHAVLKKENAEILDNTANAGNASIGG